MADYPGEVDRSTGLEDVLRLKGRETGFIPPSPGEVLVAPIAAPYGGGENLTYVDHTTPSTSTALSAGEVVEKTTFAHDWFETVHLLPRATIEFGNIITQTDERFELFSAFRHDTITLLSITNNATPGVELPDLSPPQDLPPLVSFTDPLSNPLAPLGQIVRALQDGLPQFDTTIDFLLGSGAGTRYLGISGNRIAFFVPDFDGRLEEILQFKTDVLTKKDGTEQRISYRKNPRQIFEGSYHLTGAQRQMVQAMLMDWQGMTVAMPVPTEEVRLTAAITGGATDTANVGTTTYTDFRVGGLAVIYRDDLTYDVLTITTVNANSIVFDQSIANSYIVNNRVAPVRLAIFQGPIRGTRYPVSLEKLDARLLVIDNDTGAPTGDVTPFSAYDGKVLLDDCNFMGGTMSERYEHKVVPIDNISGNPEQRTTWDKNKRTHNKGFSVKSRQSLFELRRLFYALKGKWTSFYIPTFIEDITVTQNLVSAASTMDISWIGYSRFIQDRDPKKILKVSFTDGSSLVRVVQSSAQLSVTEERLTLDTTWGVDKIPSEVERVQFYELVRIDTDDIKFQHSTTIGRAKVDVPVKVVFD